MANAAATLITNHPAAAVALAEMMAAFFDHLASVAGDDEARAEQARHLAELKWKHEQQQVAKAKQRARK